MIDFNNALAKALEFLSQEPNPPFKTELQNLIHTAQQGDMLSQTELHSRFNSYLTFGTAGIRGAMACGTNRINRVMIAKISYAIAQHFLQFPLSPPNNLIVLAHDARLNSQEFAEEACSVFAGYGFKVATFEEPTPTPVCAYAVRKLGAIAGVVITASHNPKNDNGVKLFAENGAQASGEILTSIESLIITSPSFAELKRITSKKQFSLALRSTIKDNIALSYLSCIQRKQPSIVVDPIVYSPLHGVGAPYACAALKDSGFENVLIVKSQEAPDGTFPTIENPNPEYLPTLEASLKLAQENQAELILVNDPDADRLAVATWSKNDQKYFALTGNQIGVLLAEQVINEAYEKNTRIVVASTIVSSRMLAAMAAYHNMSYTESITGFANITRAALQHQHHTGELFAFAYEEALGYLTSNCVYDKDGISAAVRMAELWAALKKRNLSLEDQLEALAYRYGVFESTSFSIPAKIDIMGTIRMGLISIESLAGEKIMLSEDYAQSLNPNLHSNCLLFENKNVGRIAIRPSGTEPKVKFYIELFGKASTQQEVSSIRKSLQETLAREAMRLENMVRLGC